MANRGINKVILIGYVGQEPKIHYMSNGNSVTHISVATTESWKDKQTNEFKERTEWHRIVLFGKLSEIASNYLHKGSQVYLEGSLRTRKWQQQNQDGQDRYITEIIVSVGGVMQILNSRHIETNKLDSNIPQINEENLQNNEKLDDTSIVNLEEDDIPF